jgi:hypothetical protein
MRKLNLEIVSESAIYSVKFADEKIMFRDKNIGSYNYSEHNEVIKKIIDAVVNKKCVEIELKCILSIVFGIQLKK